LLKNSCANTKTLVSHCLYRPLFVVRYKDEGLPLSKLPFTLLSSPFYAPLLCVPVSLTVQGLGVGVCTTSRVFFFVHSFLSLHRCHQSIHVPNIPCSSGRQLKLSQTYLSQGVGGLHGRHMQKMKYLQNLRKTSLNPHRIKIGQ
jgi:hypothetical protein